MLGANSHEFDPYLKISKLGNLRGQEDWLKLSHDAAKKKLAMMSKVLIDETSQLLNSL